MDIWLAPPILEHESSLRLSFADNRWPSKLRTVSFSSLFSLSSFLDLDLGDDEKIINAFDLSRNRDAASK